MLDPDLESNPPETVESEIVDPNFTKDPRGAVDVHPIHFMGNEADFGNRPGDFRPKPYVEPESESEPVVHVFEDEDLSDIEVDEPHPEFPPVMNVPGSASADSTDLKVHADAE